VASRAGEPPGVHHRRAELAGFIGAARSEPLSARGSAASKKKKEKKKEKEKEKKRRKNKTKKKKKEKKTKKNSP